MTQLPCMLIHLVFFRVALQQILQPFAPVCISQDSNEVIVRLSNSHPHKAGLQRSHLQKYKNLQSSCPLPGRIFAVIKDSNLCVMKNEKLSD
jgi:hypothetical protein